MKQAYKLSICMMVKDEEKNLTRCLAALGPLLEKPDVELIIVDTGSSDKTVEIAKCFTQKVYFYQWNGNFSEVRNVTISYAKGERIFILDADEVLLDAERLYELMTDTRLDQFNTFILKIKNYSSLGDKALYTVLPQERIFTNDGEFRYEGSVHNQPKFKEPLLNTDIMLDHFGYTFANKELKEKKFVRTGGILRAELDKDPDNAYYRFQLARSYKAHGDSREALEEIRKAYRIISQKPIEEKKKLIYIYSAYALIASENNEFEEAYALCKEGIEICNEHVDLFYVLAFAAVNLNKRAEAVDYYKKYLDLVKTYNKLKISADRSIEIHYMGGYYVDGALQYIAVEALKDGNYIESYNNVNNIEDIEAKAQLIIKILLKQKKFEELGKFYSDIDKDSNMKASLTSLIEAEKKQLPYEDKISLEKNLTLGEGNYSLLNRIRTQGCSERQELLDEALKTFDFNDLPEFYADIFINMDRNMGKYMPVFKKIRKLKLQQYLKFVLNRDEKAVEYLEDYVIREKIRESDLQSLRASFAIAGALLFEQAGKIKNECLEISDRYMDIFRLYIDCGIKYFNILYNTERMRLYYNTLEDPEDRFLAAMHYAREAVEKGNTASGINYFKEAARANPYMACYLNVYKNQLFQN